MNRGVFCLLIIIFYHQLAGYILSNFEVKPLHLPEIRFVARLGEVAPGTFLFYMKGDDGATIIGFFIINMIITVVFVYIFGITIVKKYF